MPAIAIVYWSGTGNTEAMAELVAAGIRDAGGDAELISASDFSLSMIDAYDAFAFGCPAMGAEELESEEFEPLWSAIESSLAGRKVSLFGSFDWGEGEWMDTWLARAERAGIEVGNTVISRNYPEAAAAAKCKILGSNLV